MNAAKAANVAVGDSRILFKIITYDAMVNLHRYAPPNEIGKGITAI